MPIVSHAEQRQVEARNPAGFGKELAQLGFIGGGRFPRGFGGRVPRVDVARWDRHQIEESATGLARVAFWRPEWNPALVTPEDMDAIPGNLRAVRFARQYGPHLFRRSAAGEG